MAARDPLDQELRELGASLASRGPSEDLATTVLTRIADEPLPVLGRVSRARRAVRAFGRWLRQRWRALAVFLAGTLVVVLVATPVGATVARWFGFGGIAVWEGPVPTNLPTLPPTLHTGLTIDEARALVDFTPVVPTALGPPDAIEVSADRRVLSMSWMDGPDGTVRLDQFGGEISPVFAKKFIDDVTYTEVGDRPALWLDQPHPLIYVGADGEEYAESARLAAQTLIWQVGEVTIRLEGDLTMRRAVEIAESA